jgi:hypothetical protein
MSAIYEDFYSFQYDEFLVYTYITYIQRLSLGNLVEGATYFY